MASGDDLEDEPPTGLGDSDIPGFPTEECPEELPDVSRHHSHLVDVLKADNELYHRLRVRRTALGVGLGRCIKVGMDNRGHRLVKTLGIVAGPTDHQLLSLGDAECYETFRELFDPVISRSFDPAVSTQFGEPQPHDFGRGSGVHLERPDSTGKYVLACKVSAARNLSDMCFPPAMSRKERNEVERILSQALLQSAVLEGEYMSMGDSQASETGLGSLSAEEEDSLLNAGLIFEAPDSKMLLATGVGRHWPDGRGVFMNSKRSLVAWINEQDHLRLTVTRKDDALDLALGQVADALQSIASAIGPDHAFAQSKRLGFLTSSPAILGTAMQVTVTVRLPHLSQDSSSAWQKWCVERRIEARNSFSAPGVKIPATFELSNMDRLGISEAGAVAAVAAAARHVVALERVMEAKHKAQAGLRLGLLSGRLPSLMEAASSSGGAAKSTQLIHVLDRRRLSVDPDKLAAPCVTEELREAHSSAVGAVAKLTRNSLQFVTGGTAEADARIQSCAQEAAAAAVARAVASCTSRPTRTEKQESRPPEEKSTPPVEADVETKRCQLARLLEEEAKSGRMGAARAVILDQMRAKEPEEVATTVASSEAGASCSACSSSSSSPASLESTRRDVASRLRTSLGDGHAKSALELMASETRAAEGRACKPQDSRDLEKQRAVALAALKRLSAQDRRLGELRGHITAMKQRVAKATESGRELQELLIQSRGNREHVELNIEWYRQALKDAEKRSEELEASQRKWALAAASLQAPNGEQAQEVASMKGQAVEDGLPNGIMANHVHAHSTVSGRSTPVAGLRLEPVASRC